MTGDSSGSTVAAHDPIGETLHGCDKVPNARALSSPLSPYARKVRLVLAEKRLPVDLQVEKPWERRPEYLELNPAGTVPTLVEDNGVVIPDSAVICEYLDKAYPENPIMGDTGRNGWRSGASRPGSMASSLPR